MSAKKRPSEVTQVAPLYVEAIEPPPIGVQPVDAVSAESVERRVQRPLPYDHDMLAHLFVRRRTVSQWLPELSPDAGRRGAMLRAIQRIERGEPAFQPPPDVDQAAMLRDLDEWRERNRRVFDEIAYGAFLEGFTAARNETLSPEVRSAAIERLVPVLRPDWMARKNRLQFAVARRQGSDLSRGDLYGHIVRAAISEAVATASVPHDVFLDRKKFTHGPSGDPVVPAYHLREPDLIHVLKARVAQLVDEDLAPEIAELGLESELSLEQLLEPHASNPYADTGAATEDAASDWSKGQPTQDWGQPTDNAVGIRQHYPTVGEIHFGDPETEALAARGLHALNVLEAEEAIRPQRAAKIDEIKSLATPELRRLIEAILETGFTSATDLASHLGKREKTVRKAMYDLRQNIGLIDPPAWLAHGRWYELPWDDGALARDRRPPPPPLRQVATNSWDRHTTIVGRPVSTGPRRPALPPTVYSTEEMSLAPWPCTLPTHGSPYRQLLKGS